MKIPKTQEKRTTIRIPVEIYDELVKVAKYHERSLNVEITERLKAAAVSDQFARLMRDNQEIKQMLKELLENN
jgi:DNA-directed RNA polymerase sigma subunit (sigma70/sigma32)